LLNAWAHPCTNFTTLNDVHELIIPFSTARALSFAWEIHTQFCF
jgi:hypothetical protein